MVEHAEAAVKGAPAPRVMQRSATESQSGRFDIVCTDPPYYDAIPYSDLMDFFHVWLRRTLHGLSPEIDATFSEPLGPKWNHDTNDGELVDQPSRFDGDGAESRKVYEDGMLRTFERCRDALVDDGRLVVVFANKQPDAWETLVSALIRASFVVTASWPIQTERESKVAGGARLSSSIWLVCKKRPASARPGWDARVLAEMQENITGRLHDFWDAGIRGPDFVWAATGPALEAFSRHPVVRKADAPGERLTVAEFLRRVRRMVVGFVVSRLLAQDGGAEGELDDPTTYYLLHRSDFDLRAAPAGACILYALSCNLSDADLAGRLDLLVRGGRAAATADEAAATVGEEDTAEQERETSGSEARLKPWHTPPRQRPGRAVGGRKPAAAHRLRAQADAALEDGPAEPGGQLPRGARALAPRAVRPRRAGHHRAGRTRLRGTHHARVHPEPRRGTRRCFRSAAGDVSARRIIMITSLRPDTRGEFCLRRVRDRCRLPVMIRRFQALNYRCLRYVDHSTRPVPRSS